MTPLSPSLDCQYSFLPLGSVLPVLLVTNGVLATSCCPPPLSHCSWIVPTDLMIALLLLPAFVVGAAFGKTRATPVITEPSIKIVASAIVLIFIIVLLLSF